LKRTPQNKPLFFFLAYLLLLLSAVEVSAQITFQRTFQAAGMNGGLSLSLTTGGGYVVTGQHQSSGAGDCDVYVYERDACGNTVFFNTYGYVGQDGGKCVAQTADGGFIVSGLIRNTPSILLMKLDAAGNYQWHNAYGNNSNDWGMYVQQTTDGGYIVTGGTDSPTPASRDVFLLKTDAAGITQWSQVFVAPGNEFSHYVEQTTDGGFFIAGYSQGSVNADADALGIKTDVNGNVQWANVYGGPNDDGNDAVYPEFTTNGQQTPDGGYAIVTTTRSFGVNGTDIWLLRLDPSGNVQWSKTYGGALDEQPRGLDVTADGGFAIVGWTFSFGFGEQDVYLLKTDSLGNLNWSKTFGGVAREKGESVRQSPIDHGYYIDGYSQSFAPDFDAYAIKTDSLGVSGCNETTPATITGTGTPTTTPFPYTLNTLPTGVAPAYIQNSYNPNEYALCESITPDVAQFINNTVCLGDSTVFIDGSTAGYGFVTDWIWDFGDGSPFDSTQNPAHTYSAAGTYSVTLVIYTTYSCIPDSITQLVIVNPLPVPLFTAPAVCFNNPTIFTDQTTTATGTITTWNWNFGDGTDTLLQNPSHTYNNPGTYTVTLIATNSFGCKDTLQQPVIVYPLPIASFSVTIVCLGNPTLFTDLTTITSGTITNWNWNFGDPNSGPNNISNAQHPSHTYTASGTFNVILTVISSDTCATTTILQVTVLPLPIAAFTAPNECLNIPTQFTDASAGAAQWQWDFGDSNTSTSQSPSHSYSGFGTYIVTQIATSAGGCKDTVMDTVTVYPVPIVNFAADTVCLRDTTSFIDLSSIPAGNIINWNWNFGDGNTSSLQNPSHAFSSDGIFNVTLSVTSNNNCTSVLTLAVLVHPLPIAEFSYIPGPTVTLTDAVFFTDLSISGIVSWAWDLGDGSTDSIQNPIHVYGDTGTYMITLIVVSQYGCVDTVEHPLKIKDFAFYIPNCFTPNGDNDNEFFFGKGIGITEYEMWIFDRWGNLIFHCDINDLPQTQPCWWNGRVRGGSSEQIVQEDVYVWKVKFTSVFKKEYNYIGHVSVVK